ncbi:MAG: malonyl-ACP O-methyltransferase BioC [Candidatus Omnitrophica bacterium]|nr:malonyl-ACP O-methyltransferase BioC [Candidatus Omnitrophota bacterium]MBU4303179.1 malonyl-ACP O-methyltransferase BioC [Candidatus Omnitrophota bacterium]MBU4468126.1 malonyl-ACP O-methyltransferase BioC [Candidatus Omnitrophota bacterium]MCG2708203.1 malonyl-ACP O-methyltransferase BioC [Candidatus Omnitrophota bacterium]
MDKSNIAHNFSRYAHLYDKYAGVQNQAALELVSSLKNNNFSKILELGCGTGNYTLMLREKFRDARIKALDISEEMISVAQNKLKHKNIEFMVADVEKIIPDQDFDLITSNACFQWLNDLAKALRGYAKSLQKGGVVCFSIFGPDTFCELNTALKSVEESRLDAAYFCNRDSLKAMLKDNFKSVKINEVCYKESFGSLKGLLEKIKYSGIRGNGLSKKVYFSRGLLERWEKAYLDRFQEIGVTYQVFFCRGEKR